MTGQGRVNPDIEHALNIVLLSIDCFIRPYLKDRTVWAVLPIRLLLALNYTPTAAALSLSDGKEGGGLQLCLSLKTVEKHPPRSSWHLHLNNYTSYCITGGLPTINHVISALSAETELDHKIQSTFHKIVCFTVQAFSAHWERDELQCKTNVIKPCW